jgi:hypothetical protein
MAAAKKKKLAKEYSYLVGSKSVTIASGTVIEGEILARLVASHPDWLVPVDEEIEPETDEGRLKDLRLTETEKPAKPKDEDPKDPDKAKKL